MRGNIMGTESLIISVLSLSISVLACIAAYIVCYVTFRTYNAQLRQLNKQELPNLKILAIDVLKNMPGQPPSVKNGEYCRIVKGESTSDYTLKGNMPIFDFQNEDIEYGFIEEIESHVGKNDAYFTYFAEKPYLMIVHASDKNRFIVDHSNVIIRLHNYGTTISALSIESFIAYYKREYGIPPITFFGDINNKITLSPEANGSFSLYFDEVTTDLNNSLCQMSASTYVELPPNMDLLRTHMIENRLKYDKLEIIFHCWDLFNNETVSKITIEYNGNFFISTTSILN